MTARKPGATGRTTTSGTSTTPAKGAAPAGARQPRRMWVLIEYLDGTADEVLRLGGIRMVIEVERRFGAWGRSMEHLAWAAFVAKGKPGELDQGEDGAFEVFVDRLAAINPCEEDGTPIARPSAEDAPPT